MFSRIGTFDVDPSKLTELVAHFHDQVVPAFSKHAGFLGYQAYVDHECGRFVGVSLWSTRLELEASGGTAKHALEVAFRIGATPVGEPQILEMAFNARPSDRGAPGA
jgi:quinol monooxygenase YgiN